MIEELKFVVFIWVNFFIFYVVLMEIVIVFYCMVSFGDSFFVNWVFRVVKWGIRIRINVIIS